MRSWEGDTANLNWPKGYSMLYSIMLSNKKGGGGVFHFHTLLFFFFFKRLFCKEAGHHCKTAPKVLTLLLDFFTRCIKKDEFGKMISITEFRMRTGTVMQTNSNSGI